MTTPTPHTIEDVDDFLAVIASLYEGARELHWREAYTLAEAVTGNRFRMEALETVDKAAFHAHLRELFA